MKRHILATVAVSALLVSCSSATNGVGRVSVQPSSAAPTSAGATTGAPTSGPPSSAPATDTASSNASLHPAPSQPLRTVTVHGSATYVVKLWAQVHNATCTDHAWGQAVIAFLRAHPCQGLDRMLGTTIVQGRAVGFAESSTSFPGSGPNYYQTASDFARLERSDNTGSINDLMREGYRLPSGPTSVPSSEAFHVLVQDTGVSIFDAWYLDGSTPQNDPALITMTEQIWLQF